MSRTLSVYLYRSLTAHPFLFSRTFLHQDLTSRYFNKKPSFRGLLCRKTRRASYSTMMAKSSRVLIFGTGSVGASYGYILSKALKSDDVVAVCRSNYDAALENGFTIHSKAWGNNLKYKPHVVRTPHQALSFGPFDYVIISSKIVADAAPVPELLRSTISKSTAIVLVQNGIKIEKPWSVAFPNNPILSCTTYLPVTQVSPAVIEHTDLELLNIGTYPAKGVPRFHKTAAENFANLIKAGGATASVYEDIQHDRWNKLLANASWNPVSALTRSRDAQFLHASPKAWEYIRDLMREVASIARAEGYNLTDDDVEKTLSRARSRSLPGVEPSMQADALAGKAMEVDAIVGNVVKIADERSVDVPLLNGLWVMIKALDDSCRRVREGKS